jgi:PAS domain S-box-containing protein
MMKPVNRSIWLYTAFIAGYLLVDQVIDYFVNGSPEFRLLNVIFSILILFVSFLLIHRALRSHSRAESVLRQARDESEMRVLERAVELQATNTRLEAEIADRRQAEQDRESSLRQAEELRHTAEALAAELQMANNRLRALIETLPAGLVIIDLEGRIVLANPLARTIRGKALAGTTYITDNGTDLWHLDGALFSSEDLPLSRAIRRGETTTGIEAITEPDGENKRYVLLAASPIYDEDDRIINAVEIIQDITHLKQVEEALQESEKRYRTQFDNFSEPNTVWDRNGILLMQNLVSAKNLGGKREDYLGKSLIDIFGEAGVAYLERIQRVIDTGLPESQEDVVLLSGGTRYFWTNMQRIVYPDGLYAAQIISYDITSRKQAEDALRASEEKFSTVFHFSPDAIGLIRMADGIFLDINEAFTSLLGYPRSEIIGKTWRELRLVPVTSERKEVTDQYLERGSIANYEMDFVTREGGQATMLISLIPIQVSGEDCILVIAHDITKRKRSEEALRLVQAELAQGIQERTALEERQRLARDLHDSVSQALYGISLGTHTALTLFETDRPKVLEALNYVLSLTQAGLAEMRALIFELRPESLELEGLAAALAKQTAALRARHGIDVELRVCDEPDISLPVKEALYRIAQEALQNAIKHSRASRLEVRLNCEPGSILLEVADNGVGFDSSTSYPGHLGLRSMRERAMRVGGRLEIISAPNQGAQISARVPVTLPPANIS